jgi:hypothetical protein
MDQLCFLSANRHKLKKLDRLFIAPGYKTNKLADH